MTASSLEASEDLRLRYLERYRSLVQAVLRNAPLAEVGPQAALTLAAALGTRSSVLLLAAQGPCYDILGSAGPLFGVLQGWVPRSLLPEAAAATDARDRLTIRDCGARHPFAPGGRAYLAPLAVGAGALAAYFPADAPFPDPKAVADAFDDVAGLLAAMGLSRPLSPAPARPEPFPAPGLRTPDSDPVLLRAVLDALPYGLVVAGTDGRLLLRNRAAVQHADQVQAVTLEIEIGEAAAPRSEGLPAWGDAALTLRRRTPLAEEGPYAARYRFHDPATGRERWAATTAVPLRLPNGDLGGVVSLSHDVTAFVEAEEEREWLFQEAQAQRALLNRLLESAPVSILLLDPDLRVRLANSRALAMLLRPTAPASVVGRTIAELAPRHVARWFAQTVAAVLRDRQEVQRVELPLRHAGRTTYWDIAAVPLQDAASSVAGVLFSGHDVTERVLARRAQSHLLAEVEAERTRVKTILDLVPAGVVALDETLSTYTVVNQAALRMATRPGAAVGQPARDCEGQRHWELRDNTGSLIPPGQTPMGRAYQERTAIHGEQLWIPRADGQLTPVLVSAAPLPSGPDGRPGGAVAVMTDITPLKEIERLKDDFLAMASHDLRSPLTVVYGRLQLVRRQLAANRTVSEGTMQSLALVLEQVQHLTELAGALLDVTRIQSGRFQVHPAPVDLAALVRRVAAPLMATSPRHTITVAAPDEGLPGRWEAGRIAQVVHNLLQNAIKYSPDGGPVTLRVQREEQDGVPYAVLTVTDAGIGIPLDEQARVFERFSRGEEARRRGLTGSGLGLYICQGIVQAHGGVIGVESAPGRGSVFTVRLPLDPPATGGAGAGS